MSQVRLPCVLFTVAKTIKEFTLTPFDNKIAMIPDNKINTTPFIIEKVLQIIINSIFFTFI